MTLEPRFYVETMTDLSALIEALSNAEGPSRELDEEIAMNLGWKHTPVYDEITGPEDIWHDGKRHYMSVPKYTSSLDAAVTLIPGGLFFHMARFSKDDDGCDVHIYSTDAPQFETVANAPTLPLALTIAALKARREG